MNLNFVRVHRGFGGAVGEMLRIGTLNVQLARNGNIEAALHSLQIHGLDMGYAIQGVPYALASILKSKM